MHNGPEFISVELAGWAEQKGTMLEYNEVRPHESLDNLPPRVFLMKNSGNVSNLPCA